MPCHAQYCEAYWDNVTDLSKPLYKTYPIGKNDFKINIAPARNK